MTVVLFGGGGVRAIRSNLPVRWNRSWATPCSDGPSFQRLKWYLASNGYTPAAT